MDLQVENERLKQENQELRAALQASEQKMQALEQRIQELTSVLNQNSRNSDWPSSRDKNRKPKRTKSRRQKSDKQAGGQQGHPGHTLQLREQPDVIQVHRPSQCSYCQTPFAQEQRAVALDKRQVHDLPPLRLVVSEHQAETLVCAACGQLSQGSFPDDVASPVQYGPRLQQLAVYLKTVQFIPYERSRQFLADLFAVNLSPGTLQNTVKRAAERLRPLVAEIKQALRVSPVVHFDESGFYIGGQRHWLHTAGTTSLTYYFAHAHRGRKGTEAMDILPHFRGTAIHDHWTAYRQYEQCRHSLCNVHHLRELTAVVENDKQLWAARLQWFLVSAKRAVEQARLAGRVALPQEKVVQIERLYRRLLDAAARANPPPPDDGLPRKRGRPKKTKVRNLIERLDNHASEVLAFVYDFNVPFDNNLAERDIRMLKVQQKISGCFRSPDGAVDFCTIRSYVSTMRKQGVCVWTALGSVFSDHILMPDLTPV